MKAFIYFLFQKYLQSIRDNVDMGMFNYWCYKSHFEMDLFEAVSCLSRTQLKYNKYLLL